MEFHKYNKLHRLGKEETKDIFEDKEDIIYIEEKIDGGNFRFMIKDNKIIIGSRTQQLTDNNGEDTNMNKMFKRCSDYIRFQLKDKDLTKLENMIFYGENCVKHTLNYDFDNMPPFLGFDILKDDKFLDWEEKNNIFKELGLPTVPLIKITKAKDITEINDDSIPKSKYAKTTAEGLVFKNYKKQIFGKYVSDKFKEENKTTFGGRNKELKESDNDEFIYRYVTNTRIDKQIFKLLEENNKLDMKLMQLLPRRVYEDIWEENLKEIIYSKWNLDLKHIMKPLSHRCLKVLNQFITNNNLK